MSLPAGIAGADTGFMCSSAKSIKRGPVILTREATPERRAFER
jgi:hypothetical protein